MRKLKDFIEERQKEVLKTPTYFAFDSEEEADEHMKDVVATSMTLAYEAGWHAGHTEGYNQGIGVCGYAPVKTPFAPLSKKFKTGMRIIHAVSVLILVMFAIVGALTGAHFHPGSTWWLLIPTFIVALSASVVVTRMIEGY